MDAIVTDSKGRPVPDLKPGDFSIRVSGVLVSVVSVEHISNDGPGPAAARRVFAVLYDSCSVSGPGEILEGLLASGITRYDILAVLPSIEGSGTAQRLSGDRSLPEASNLVSGRPRVARECSELWDRDAVVNRSTGRSRPIFAEVPSYNAIATILDGLAGVQGRKNLVVISRFWGWNTLGARSKQIQTLIDLANRAGVAIHVLDPTRADRLDQSGGMDSITRRLTGHVAALRRMAASTGGLFFMDEPRRVYRDTSESWPRLLRTSLKAVAADSALYYRLGYVARTARDAGKSPTLDVKVTSRRGLKVRSWANSVPPPPAAAPSRDERLQAALRSPFVGNEIGVRVFPHVSAAEPEGAKGRLASKLRAYISVEAGDLILQDEPGGRKQASVAVIASAYGRENRQAAVAAGSCSMNIAAGARPQASGGVMLCELDLGVLQPGGYVVRVAVADKAGVKVGSAYAFAPVRDFNSGEPELSTLVLEAPLRLPDIRVTFGVPADVSEPSSEPFPSRANRVNRVFAPGATVAYS
ncbi:MAG TPA: hypothetical protein VLH09_01085, partial [Bryobacteraceae bacterium]|nr:hypothetical protein [Bryobacteraceae bacterium]